MVGNENLEHRRRSCLKTFRLILQVPKIERLNGKIYKSVDRGFSVFR